MGSSIVLSHWGGGTGLDGTPKARPFAPNPDPNPNLTLTLTLTLILTLTLTLLRRAASMRGATCSCLPPGQRVGLGLGYP